MTIYQPPMEPTPFGNAGPPPGQPQMSVSALISFITGLLMCMPGTGVLAIIFGGVGISATGAGKKTGRWMAITGLILGLLSTLGWGGGTFFVVKAMNIARAEFNRQATVFVSNVQAGDFAKVTPALAPGINQEQLAAFAVKLRPLGAFKSATITEIHSDKAGGETYMNLGGMATFETGGAMPYHLKLHKTTGDFKIETLELGTDITLP